MADSSQERLNMWHHGTMQWSPTPNVVYQTAVDNLRKFNLRGAVQHDRARAKMAGANPRHQGTSKGTAFLSSHLSSAKSPADVIRAAIKGYKEGRLSRNVETLAIYKDLETLQQALSIAERNESQVSQEA